ncbi:MAG: M23 family metallopeptidase, partial [Thermoleophilia bacterium]|nr:M23 family metallopeptidase [Thermoleophilia bacterium]
MGTLRESAIPKRPSWKVGLTLLAALALLAIGIVGHASAAANVSGSAFGAQLGGATVASAGLKVGADAVTVHHGAASGGGSAVGAVRVELAPFDDSIIGVSSASDVRLANDRVTIASVSIDAIATAGGRTGVGSLSVAGLVVDGAPVAASVGTSVEIAGVGRLIFGEQVSGGEGNLRVNAVRLEVSDASSGLPLGTAAVIGHLQLSATPKPAPVPDSGPSPDPGLPADDEPAAAPRSPAAQAAPKTESPKEVEPLPEPSLVPEYGDLAPLPPAAPTAVGLPRRAAPPVDLPRDGSYAFPVARDYGYIDDYGAPRAVTGWHHGNDIFAPTGTPVVAVAGGTLSKVGVNTLGGNRLWLTDDRGNQFYYAHLSAYAPSAINGARVGAGEVIGFVGNSGQAITTPPHLHFEIHPGGLDSVNPYPYLLAWERGSGVALAFEAATVSTGQAPAAGALLVEITPDRDVLPADDS